MKAAAVLKWLMPKEERFHELFDRDTANLVRGAGLFAEIAALKNLGDRRVKWVELKRVEHEGDGVTRQIFDTLNSTFITPLDREDIRSIATDLDDILDYLEAVAHDLVLFDRGTANLVKAAALFADIAALRSLGDRRVKWVELKRVEHEGDGITRQIFDALNSTFITPLDREDIRSIATDLDDILDYLEAVAHDLVLFDLDDSPEALRQFAEILVHMAAEISTITSLLWDLGNEARIREVTVRISDLENQADQLYSAVIADLFRDNGRNPLEILKWKEVYEGLEEACDQCKDYTHVVGNIVVKNS